MRAVVFIGPSMPNMPTIPDGIDFQPPAAAGDIYRATRRGARLIGLVDARFNDLQTVQHKEILFALEQGIHVWGAASMGALRAAECDAFGMRGIGGIYQDYRDGTLVDDHEVALLHGPPELGYPALTEPLVNVRATLAKAESDGTLSLDEALSALNTAASIPYRSLTWRAISEAVESSSLAEKIARLGNNRVDRKKSDAAELIAAVADAASWGLAPFRPEFALQRTHHWQRFEARFSNSQDALTDEESAVIDELRLNPVRYRQLVLRAFARQAAAVDMAANDGLVDEFRADLGLSTAEAFRDWMVSNTTTEERLRTFLAQDSALEDAIDKAASDLASLVLDDLRADHAYIGLLERARAKAERLSGRTSTVPESFVEFDLLDLLNWFCHERKLEVPVDDPDSVAHSLGLADRNALHQLLRREFEFARLLE